MRLLSREIVAARPILQEYDASTIDVLAGILPLSNLWKWSLLVATRPILQEYESSDGKLAKKPALWKSDYRITATI